jgi:hypothetical protein
MTSDQYALLLADLARVAGLSGFQAAALSAQGHITVGGLPAVLVHDESFEPDLLQARIVAGSVADAIKPVVMQAMLESNYLHGWGNECVFSLLPRSGEVVLTLRVALQPSLSAQDLWHALDDVAGRGRAMCELLQSPPRTAPPHQDSLFPSLA